MHRIIRQGVVATATVALLLGGGAALADEHQQPANLGAVNDFTADDRGASAEGPHCHLVLPAQGKGNFADIVTGAAHQAHVQTGLPTGVFQAEACPNPSE